MDYTNNNLNNYQQSQQSNGYVQNVINEQRASESAQTNGFTTPPQQMFSGEQMQGSMQKILSENIGEYVVIEFLVGTEKLMRKQGIIYSVGTSFIALYDDAINNFIVCDIFSIKFVYFYLPGDRPRQNYNLLNGNARTTGNVI